MGLRRAEELQAKNFISAEALDVARENLNQSLAKQSEIQAKLDKMTIRAPFEGVAGLRQVSPGAYVKAGQDIARLEGIGTLKLDFRVPEIFLRKPFINSMDGAVAAQKKWAMYDVLMKSETLDQEFAEFAAERGKALGFSDKAVDIINKQAEKHKNVSKRTLESYRDYYTDELRDLVATRDRFFIDLFGYTF